MKYSILWLCFFTAIAHGEITVIDYLNRSITVPKPAQRVIALAPHITENIFSAGAGDTLVGVVEHSDFPIQANKIKRVGSVSLFSLEKILSLSPDLVIVWASAMKDNIVEQLNALGVPVYVDDPRVLLDIVRSIRDFGALTGRVKESSEAIHNYRLEIQQLQYQYQQANNISVFYEVWNNPLQTIGGQHIISDIIKLCGGKNVFDDALLLAPKVNIETVIKRNPDIIITGNSINTTRQWLDYWQTWPTLTAVRYRRLHFIDPDLIQRHTTRIAIGAKIMCQYIAAALTKES